jgi:hypothetical protein
MAYFSATQLLSSRLKNINGLVNLAALTIDKFPRGLPNFCSRRHKMAKTCLTVYINFLCSSFDHYGGSAQARIQILKHFKVMAEKKGL